METTRVPVVTGRSREKLERAALRFVRDYFPEGIDNERPVPIADIVEYDMPERRQGLIVRVANLPEPLEANTDPFTKPGIIDLAFSPRTYDLLRDGNFRARFTAAHEAGHVELHAVQIPHSISLGEFRGFARRSDLRAYEDPEWQANYFAACVLMNREIVNRIVGEHGRSAEAVSSMLQVSHPAAAKRLIYLYGTVQ